MGAAKASPFPISNPISSGSQSGSGNLAILKDNKQLVIGSSVPDASAIFPRPTGLHVYSVTSVPEALKDYNLTAVGWDSENAGFGALLSSNQIQAAIYTEKNDSLQRVQGLVGNYIGTFGQPTTQISSENVQSSFWQKGSIRLMVLQQKIDANTFRITIALGQTVILNRIRANPQDLRADFAKLKDMNSKNNGS